MSIGPAVSRLAAAAQRRRGAPSVTYLDYVLRFADTLLAAGLDVVGPKKTPLWAGVIDAETLSAPQEGVPPPPGVRESDRAVGGCNLYHDAVTLRVFRVLSAVSGKPEYAGAARQYIDFYLSHAVDEATGFLGWGEHLYYDFYRDEVAAERRWHELLEWTPPWAELWEVNAAATSRAIQALRYHYESDDGAALYNRHAAWGRAEHQASGGQPWIKHSGLFAYSFMFLHKQTGDRRWLAWSRAAGELYWKHRNVSTDLTPSCIGDAREEAQAASAGMTQLGYWLVKTYQLYPRETAIWTRAVALLKAYQRFFYDARRDGYLVSVSVDGSPRGEELARPWEISYGGTSLLSVGRIAAYFARTEKDPVFLEMARRIARIAKRTPAPDNVSIEGVGFALNLSLDLYDVTGEKAYLDEARSYVDSAVRKFWKPTPTGGLFVRQPYDRYYEAKVGAGDLLAGLLRLHMRQGASLKDPALYDWSF
ncbi:MAG: hypothetical protein KIT09_17490 [Bryobacteraceae bacterium]|nr:hypothetical protein [Bryobacteraceae bacterium]